MKKNIIVILTLMALTVLSGSGQDLNQSNLRYLPMYLNPGLCGNFKGSVRLGGSYRDQGQNWMLNAYHTYQFFADFPVSFSLKAGDWAGFGIQVYGDNAGTLPLTTNGAILNLAYHLSLDKKQNKILSIGIQYGFVNRRLDEKEMILESDLIDPGVALTDRVNFSAFSRNYNDLNFGLHFRSSLRNGGLFSLGISAYHLLQTNSEFIIDQNFYDRRFSFHTALLFRITKQLFFKPELIASTSKNAFNIMPQIKTFFKLNKDKRKTEMIYFGTGYRLQDAIMLMFGFNFKNWDIGMTYDITVSSLAQYNSGKGGIEIGISRVFLIKEKPNPVPVLICPRL